MPGQATFASSETSSSELSLFVPGNRSRDITLLPIPSSSASDPLLAALGHDPVTLDALAARTGLTAAALSVRLLDLELSGYVARLPGQLFQRLARA